MHPSLVRSPFHRPGWVYEEKVDGWRILACKDGQHVRLFSRHGVDHTKRFARRRAGHRQAARLHPSALPQGRDLSARPLRHRRARLEDVVAGSELVFPVRRLAPDGLEIERGYEGLVAKDEASAYQGGRTTRWLKVKQRDWTLVDDRWQRQISVAAAGEQLRTRDCWACPCGVMEPGRDDFR